MLNAWRRLSPQALLHRNAPSLLPNCLSPITVPQRSLSSTTSAPVHPSLVDSFGRKHTYLRISLTEKCNLRCKYCMPEEGVELLPNDHLLSNDEIGRLVRLFAHHGVSKVRLTGGEGLTEICSMISGTPGIEALGITTNGLVLHRYLGDLKAAGLTSLNISLDTLIPAKFEFITRRRGYDRVWKSIYAALDQGFENVKINCVVMRGVNEDELLDFVEITKELPLNVRFIEYMPFGGNNWSDARFYPFADMLHAIREKYPSFKKLPTDASDTAKRYHVPGYAGEVGFITSMSKNFCGGCNRIRLTADGNLKVCLFGTDEVSLLKPMREGASDSDLLELIGAAVFKKHAALGGNGDMYGIAASSNRPMIRIGG